MSLKEAAQKLGVKVDGRWSDAKIQEVIDNAAPKSNTEEAVDKFKTVEWANERAKLIWAGQSTPLDIIQRTGRIRFALKEKGFTDFEAMDWPHPDCKKYI